jgi:hypothetical protein
MQRAKTVRDATIQQQILYSVLSKIVRSIFKLVFQQIYRPPNSIFIS